jgi:thioredoxin reductase (NADPH)
MSREDVDCVVIGGGPAGLTAAIYLTRYRRRVVVLDAGHSRAALIPRTRNYPGYANGISGTDLLAVLRTQAESYGVTILASEAQMIVKEGNLFRVTGRQREGLGATCRHGDRACRYQTRNRRL